MKFLLVLAVVLVAFWIWRNNRLNERPGAPPPPAPGKPVAMLACDHCGTQHFSSNGSGTSRSVCGSNVDHGAFPTPR